MPTRSACMCICSHGAGREALSERLSFSGLAMAMIMHLLQSAI